jgi:hypothetical protein
VKPRHLIFIVLIGTSLIAVAPTAEKAGQADKADVATEPAQDVKVIRTQKVNVEPEASRAKIQPASFSGDAGKLKKQ